MPPVGDVNAMKYASSMLIVVSVVATFGAVATPLMGQKYEKGDSAIVLTDSNLKVGTTHAGTVRRGQVLKIGKTQGEWLWVEANLGPERLEDCMPSRNVAVMEFNNGDIIESIELANPMDGEAFGGFSSVTTPKYSAPLAIRSNAQWGVPKGKTARGWIRSSSVAPAIELRVEGSRLLYSVPEVERLTRQRAPTDGLWPFGVLSLAIISAEQPSGQPGVVQGLLSVQPVAANQPVTLDLPSGKCGVFLVVTRPGQSPMPGSALVVVE
jgi:hypothetical protein